MVYDISKTHDFSKMDLESLRIHGFIQKSKNVCSVCVKHGKGLLPNKTQAEAVTSDLNENELGNEKSYCNY